MNYEELIKKYPLFYYHGFEIEEDEKTIKITQDFEIEGLSHFNPTFRIPKPANSVMISDLRVFREAACSLGLVELISYWKQTCSPKVVIECTSLDEKQIAWWKKLYFHGLGEFFYINGIQTTVDDFMEIECSGQKIQGLDDHIEYHGNLIPVGGGKDSFVSLDVLKDLKEENNAFIINHIKSAMASAEAAGYEEGKNLIVVSRSLDSRMLDNNKKGFLNGHTPFSAMAAFASVLTSIVYGRKYICLSNEASANESTIKGSTVNHQYSKTFEFEQDFKWYMDTYVTPEIHYFSLLRPISELMIAGIFSKLEDYLNVFRSCNVGQKDGVWCGHCAKCLFVYIILSAYLKDERMIEIFGRNMLDDLEMKELFEQLSGILDDKPFECVGTREEVNVAIVMCIRHHQLEGKALPLLLEQYRNSKYYEFYKDTRVDFDFWNNENLVPEEYQRILKQRLEEMKV